MDNFTIAFIEKHFNTVYASKSDGVLSALPKTTPKDISNCVFLPRVNAQGFLVLSLWVM
jgi:hypothetical protein